MFWTLEVRILPSWCFILMIFSAALSVNFRSQRLEQIYFFKFPLDHCSGREAMRGSKGALLPLRLQAGLRGLKSVTVGFFHDMKSCRLLPDIPLVQMTVYRNPPNMAIILVVGILGGPHPRYTFLSSQFWCDIMGSIHFVARELRVHLHSLPPKNSRAMHMGFNPRFCVLVSRLDF